MSELDDAIARLDRAVARLERAPGLNRRDPGPELAQMAREHARERAAEGERVQQLTSAIVTRVEAALHKIGKALKEE